MELSEKINDYGVEDDFHFMLYEPKVRPKMDFGKDLRYHLSVICGLVDLDRYEMAVEDKTKVAKVRLCLSADVEDPKVSLESAIQSMCRAILAPGDDSRKSNVECLTTRSIWGIVPVSAVFSNYWTASFFESSLSGDLAQLEHFAEDLMQEARPYAIPTFMVFGFAAVAGIIDCFKLMRLVNPSNINDIIFLNPRDQNSKEIELEGLINKALPTVELVLRWFATGGNREPAPSEEWLNKRRQRSNEELDLFKRAFDKTLGHFHHFRVNDGKARTVDALELQVQDTAWSHQACYHLCKMMHAAGDLATTNEQFFDEIVRSQHKSREEMAKAAISTGFGTATIVSAAWEAIAAARTAAAVGAATGSAIPVTMPLVVAGLTSYSLFVCIRKYQKAMEHDKEKARVLIVHEATKNAWSGAFRIRLALDWFRLEGGKSPSVIKFADPRIQREWRKFVKAYSSHTQLSDGENLTEARLLSHWFKVEVEALGEYRARLD